MKITLILYLTDVLVKLHDVLVFFVGASLLITLVVGFVTAISSTDHDSDEENSLHQSVKKILKRIERKWYLILITILLTILIPTKSTVYAMLGANYLSNSDLPVKVHQLVELKLDDVIKQLKKDKDD